MITTISDAEQGRALLRGVARADQRGDDCDGAADAAEDSVSACSTAAVTCPNSSTFVTMPNAIGANTNAKPASEPIQSARVRASMTVKVRTSICVSFSQGRLVDPLRCAIETATGAGALLRRPARHRPRDAREGNARRSRDCGRSRQREGDRRAPARANFRRARSSARKARASPARAASAGSSIRSTARRTSRTATRCSASRSASSATAR